MLKFRPKIRCRSSAGNCSKFPLIRALQSPTRALAPVEHYLIAISIDRLVVGFGVSTIAAISLLTYRFSFLQNLVLHLHRCPYTLYTDHARRTQLFIIVYEENMLQFRNCSYIFTECRALIALVRFQMSPRLVIHPRSVNRAHS